MRLAAAWALLPLLAACGGGDPAGGDPGAQPDPAALCLRSECADRSTVATVPDAENILFTADGRLFVSGGTNVFEIVREQGGYTAYALHAGACNFTGLAAIGETLYANCFDGQLYAARLGAAPLLQPIHALNLAAPNGLVDGPDGELYLVNGPLSGSALPDPKIVRLRLDPQDPLRVVEQTIWTTEGLMGPNGIQRSGRTLYVSNTGPGGLGEIRRYEIGADGSAGLSSVHARFNSIPDDFSVLGAHLLVSWYSSGQIALLDPDGEVLQQSGIGTFEFPSQVRSGRPPLFATADVLVTEKGQIGDTGSDVGNRLTLLRPRN